MWHRSTTGFSLAELLVSLFILSLGVLAVAPLFTQAMQGNASSRDLGLVGVAVERRIERLREQEFDSLVPGGSITADVNGYHDTSEPDVNVRWHIADSSATIPGTKVLTVRAVRQRMGYGPAADVTSITLRGD